MIFKKNLLLLIFALNNHYQFSLQASAALDSQVIDFVKSDSCRSSGSVVNQTEVLCEVVRSSH